MSNTINLIHAGLPWTSPQKISIHSSQYINNVVINRGLLSLLNNDYYLEIKTQAINNYIEKNIGNHINDDDLHVSWKRINELLLKVGGAYKDCAYLIPLYWNNRKIEYFQIQNMLSLIPKTLNGHTIIICFCNAYSNQYDINKINIQKTVQIQNFNLLFNGFQGGDVIICSTTDLYLINNYTILSQLEATQDISLQLFQNVQSAIDSNSKFESNNGITIIGNGLNRSHSVMTIKNCSASVYIINLAIKNNLILTQEKLQEYLNNIQYLPYKKSLLNFYPLNNYAYTKLLYKDLYLNTQYLYEALDYSLNFINGSAEDIIKQDTFENSFLRINTSGYLENAVEPQYLAFSKDGSELSLSQQIRSCLYNWKNKTPHCTIAFWGRLDSQCLKYNNNPIFSDYTNQIGEDFGLYVYANKLYRTAENIQDAADYSSDFEKHYTNIINQWGLYVLEFIHGNGMPSDDSFPELNNINVEQGFMRVNLSFYNTKNEMYGLIPNKNTIDNVCSDTITNKTEYLQNVGYEFKKLKESDFYDKQYPLKLFANKKFFNSTINIKNWDYFSGDLRNIYIFKNILTKTQISSLIKAGQYKTSFNWAQQGQDNAKSDIALSSSFSAVASYNNQNLNIIQTDIITNG